MDGYVKYKNKLFGFSLATTIIDGLISLWLVFMAGYAIYIRSMASELMHESSEAISAAGEHELTGGYEVLFGMGNGLVGLIGSFFGTILLIASGFVLLIVLVVTVYGIVVCAKAQKRFLDDRNQYIKAYRRDSIIKIVLHGSFAFLLLVPVCVDGSFNAGIILAGCLMLAVAGVSIANLRMIKAGKEIPG